MFLAGTPMNPFADDDIDSEDNHSSYEADGGGGHGQAGGSGSGGDAAESIYAEIGDQ
jgi:hypothetical protein